MAKTSFNELLLAVAPEYRVSMEKPNDKPLKQECGLVVKEVKSEYTATYQLEKRTVTSWVFRKTGIWTHVYGGNIGRYEGVVAALPAYIQRKMAASRDCKRLIDPGAYNDTCVKGFVYSLNGETQRKYRNDGMLFLLIEETTEYTAGLTCAEAAARKPALQQLNR